jgi:hypothetical protein
MSQLLIEYSIHFKIVFGLALNFYVYIDDDDKSSKTNFILMVASVEGSFLKLNFFMNYLWSTNNSREVKWLDDSIYQKKSLDEIDLDDISDDFVSLNVRIYF